MSCNIFESLNQVLRHFEIHIVSMVSSNICSYQISFDYNFHFIITWPSPNIIVGMIRCGLWWVHIFSKLYLEMFPTNISITSLREIIILSRMKKGYYRLLHWPINLFWHIRRVLVSLIFWWISGELCFRSLSFSF